MIYLDHAASTPLDKTVYEAMQPYFIEVFGNASSQHSYGRTAANAVLAARDTVAKLVGCAADEVFFTSGGTEADNWALKGVCLAKREAGKHIVLSAIEHPALMESARDMRALGFDVTLVDPNENGLVTAKSVENALRPDTVFVGIMAANNEVGTLEPVEEIGKLCKQRGVFFFTDCVQTAGVLPLPIQHCQALSLSAHKFYGPKGVGALVLKKGERIARFMAGGHQERAMRGGTLNVPAIVGMAKALELAYKEREQNAQKVRALRDLFVDEVMSQISGVQLNGDKVNRLPANANLSFQGCQGENILFLLDLRGIAVSTGSACSSGAVTISHVLSAMGLSAERAKGAVRFTFGKDNTKEEVDKTVFALKEVVEKIRSGK
jgi:cysteine desulfurase